MRLMKEISMPNIIGIGVGEYVERWLAYLVRRNDSLIKMGPVE
jgi:hypothetical protein